MCDDPKLSYSLLNVNLGGDGRLMVEEKRIQTALFVLEAERVQGRRLLAELLEGRRTWEELGAEEQRIASGPALIDWTLDRSFQARFKDPERMVELAEAARCLADRLNLDPLANPAVADLQARVWAELGNAYRVSDQMRKADRALTKARELEAAGTGSPALGLRISELLASLRIDQRRFGEAEKLLRALGDTYRSQGQAEKLAGVLMKLGRVRDQAHEPKQAVWVYGQALEVMKPDSPLRLAAVHGLAFNLIEAGMPEFGLKVLERHRRLYRRAGKLVQIRLWWAEGKAMRGLKQLERAETKLTVARLAFLRENQDFDAALVALDLGLVLALRRKPKELGFLVGQMLATFRTLGVGQEVLASVLLLKESCEESAPAERLCGQIEILARMLPEVKWRRPGKRASKKK